MVPHGRPFINLTNYLSTFFFFFLPTLQLLGVWRYIIENFRTVRKLVFLKLDHLMYCLCECFEKNMEIFNYMVSSSQKLVLCFTYSLLG